MTDETDQPAAHLEEESQGERGAEGSRDTGADEPAGGPSGRTPGTSDEDSDTSVDPQGANHDDSPHLPSGG